METEDPGGGGGGGCDHEVKACLSDEFESRIVALEARAVERAQKYEENSQTLKEIIAVKNEHLIAANYEIKMRDEIIEELRTKIDESNGRVSGLTRKLDLVLTNSENQNDKVKNKHNSAYAKNQDTLPPNRY